jgi:CBS domain-containing protein
LERYVHEKEAEMREVTPMLADLRVADAMHPGILTCPRETPLRSVARMMAAYDVHAIVVFGGLETSRETEFWGVVSDLDLIGAALAGDLDDRTAETIASTPVLLVSGRETVEEAARRMTENAIARLIVVEPDTKRPVGIISTLDIAAALAGTELRVGPPRAGSRDPAGVAS